MSTPITIDGILAIIGVIVAVEGLLKAIEWGIGKITAQHDKAQQIDENSESLEEYKAKTDKAIESLRAGVDKAHFNATSSLATLESNIRDALTLQKKELMQNIKDDKDEYLEGIKRVEASILDMQASYQQTVAIIDVKIENLTKQVEKHNSVVERTYGLERDVAVLDQRETASEKRIRELEGAK